MSKRSPVAASSTPSLKLPIITKLAYGAGDLSPAIVSTINGFFLNAFLIEVAGIRPATSCSSGRGRASGWANKQSITSGLAASNLVLEAAGYVKPAYAGASLAPVQPDRVLLALRVFVGLVPVVILLLSYVVMARYPISRERHAEIRAVLAARRRL